MERNTDCDLRACLSIQPRRYAIPARKTQELASLLSLVNNDSARAVAILREIKGLRPSYKL